MTRSTIDLLSLAEETAAGRSKLADAASRLSSEHADDGSVDDLRALIGAIDAVRAHRLAFQESLAAAPSAPPTLASAARPTAVTGGGVRRRHPGSNSRRQRRTLFLLAAMLLLGGAVAGGALIAGSLVTEPSQSLDRATMPPSIVPVEATVMWQSVGDPFIVSTRRVTKPQVSFASRYEDWIARPDGSDATKLDGAWQVAWARDGRRLLVATATGGLFFADVTDAVGPLIDSGLSTHPEKGCPRRAGGRTTCQHQFYDLAPDGRHLAFVQQPNHHPGSYGVALMDLSSGKITVLEATLSSDRHPISDLRWSPDGSRLVYARVDDLRVLSEGGDTRSELWIVDADGAGLRRLDTGAVSAVAPDWSPDGRTIVFASDIWRTESEHESDLYSITSDGDDLQRRSTDGRRSQPEWLADGRIRYWDGQRFWIMSADGGQTEALPVLTVPAISGTGLPASGFRIQPVP